LVQLLAVGRLFLRVVRVLDLRAVFLRAVERVVLRVALRPAALRAAVRREVERDLLLLDRLRLVITNSPC
jgi:hypothetical protein